MSEYINPLSVSEEDEEYGSAPPWGFLAGLLVGGLTVGAAAMMLAPKTGKQISAKMLKKSIKLRNKANQAVEKAQARTRAVTEQLQYDMRTKANELHKRGQDLIDEQKERMSSS